MIAFVILHYKNLEKTTNAINSLLKLSGDKKIIVVDNFSNDGSLEALKEKFEKNQVIFVEQKQNGGYAAGNNAGYQYAVKNFNPEFIICMNNDVTVPDINFSQSLHGAYIEYKFDVLGPDIITDEEVHQNPYSLCQQTIKQASKYLLKLRLKSAFPRLSLKYAKRNKKQTISPLLEAQENVPLHGSFMVFSESFIRNNHIPFCPDTFLYGEEDILFYKGVKSGAKFVYYPKIKVLHHETVDTSLSVDKYIFMLKEKIKSTKVLIRLMKK